MHCSLQVGWQGSCGLVLLWGWQGPLGCLGFVGLWLGCKLAKWQMQASGCVFYFIAAGARWGHVVSRKPPQLGSPAGHAVSRKPTWLGSPAGPLGLGGPRPPPPTAGVLAKGGRANCMQPDRGLCIWDINTLGQKTLRICVTARNRTYLKSRRKLDK